MGDTAMVPRCRSTISEAGDDTATTTFLAMATVLSHDGANVRVQFHEDWMQATVAAEVLAQHNDGMQAALTLSHASSSSPLCAMLDCESVLRRERQAAILQTARDLGTARRGRRTGGRGC